MCAVSMIYDYGRTTYPNWQPSPNNFPNVDVKDPYTDALKKYIKLIEAAKEFDKASGQPDCEDPEKEKFMKEILDRLDKIEKKLK